MSPMANRRTPSEFSRSGRELFGERSRFPYSTCIPNGFAGDVNLENRLQKAARNIPQPQQMRAYSTTSRSSNALRDSRHSRRAPLMSFTRSYATQTTNPNPPYGKPFAISRRQLSTSFSSRFRLQEQLQSNPIKSCPYRYACKSIGDAKLFLIMLRGERLHRPRYGMFPCTRVCDDNCKTRFMQKGVRADCDISISFDQPTQRPSPHGSASCKWS